MKFSLELFSNYIFPSAHELNIYSCITNDDCDKRANVECGYLNQKSEYKVCKCKEGSLLDPKSQTCGKENSRFFSNR
jgi:hypothetical protein